MKTITRVYEAYEFSELDDDAKQKAISHYQQHWLDYEWWDFIYDDFREICKIIGIDVENIYFSGFWSQGDGACFEGDYYYKKGCLAGIKEYAPKDEELHCIAERLVNTQKPYFYGLHASVKHSGHYHNSRSNYIAIDHDYCYIPESVADDIKESLRDLMNWLYTRLESGYDYLTSEENIKETYDANEVFFNEDGSII
jgi:hypothetical protein